MTPDLCDHTGALRLKSRIEAYWKERGHDVSVSLEQAGYLPAVRLARTDVRSNMVNGLPLAAAMNRVDQPALQKRHYRGGLETPRRNVEGAGNGAAQV